MSDDVERGVFVLRLTRERAARTGSHLDYAVGALMNPRTVDNAHFSYRLRVASVSCFDFDDIAGSLASGYENNPLERQYSLCGHFVWPSSGLF